jgi:hypothetical protein
MSSQGREVRKQIYASWDSPTRRVDVPESSKSALANELGVTNAM